MRVGGGGDEGRGDESGKRWEQNQLSHLSEVWSGGKK